MTRDLCSYVYYQHTDITALTDATIHVIAKWVYLWHTASYFSRSEYWLLFHLCFGHRSLVSVVGTSINLWLWVSRCFVFVVGDIVILAPMFRARKLNWMLCANSDLWSVGETSVLDTHTHTSATRSWTVHVRASFGCDSVPLDMSGLSE
jgi:hypothetical protein